MKSFSYVFKSEGFELLLVMIAFSFAFSLL